MTYRLHDKYTIKIYIVHRQIEVVESNICCLWIYKNTCRINSNIQLKQIQNYNKIIITTMK